MQQKQTRLIEKLSEARDLKVDIDNKEHNLLDLMKQKLNEEEFEFVVHWLKDRTYFSIMKYHSENVVTKHL